ESQALHSGHPHQLRRMTMDSHENVNAKTLRCAPWNRGNLIGPKPPLRPKHVGWFAPSSRSCAAAMSSRLRSKMSHVLHPKLAGHGECFQLLNMGLQLKALFLYPATVVVCPQIALTRVTNHSNDASRVAVAQHLRNDVYRPEQIRSS